jgi:hypothetical protein
LTVALSDNTVLTVARTSIDLKPKCGAATTFLTLNEAMTSITTALPLGAGLWAAASLGFPQLLAELLKTALKRTLEELIGPPQDCRRKYLPSFTH